MKRLKNIDPFTTFVPFASILVCCAFFVLSPESSTYVVGHIRSFLGDGLGIYYLVIGLGIFITSLYMAFSRYGTIKLGPRDEKPQYGLLSWGTMMFTAGMAADILFYSLCEWILYANEPHIRELGSIQDWASTIPLFHWGPTVWSFYATLAVSFGFMLHVRGGFKQKYSEAARPILGDKTDGPLGKIVDIIAVFALIAGTATTFSLATPLLASAIARLFGFTESTMLTIAILIIVFLVYTVSVMKGMKGIRYLANICMYVFLALLLYVFLFSGEARYIAETGFSAIGNLAQNFIVLSTWTDALRTSGFPQNWTIFYWAYWMVWCVATPFFIGSISRGRTVKEVVLGVYFFGMGSTFLSFIILGNYSLGLNMHGTLDVMGLYQQSGDLYTTIMAIMNTLPIHQIALILLIVSMIAFYATTFDAITLVASNYSYKKIAKGEEAERGMKLFWALALIILPIALVFSKSSMDNLQSISIIAAFPVAIAIILIIISFFKDAKKELN